MATARILTHGTLESLRLVFPRDEEEVDRNARKNHQESDSRFNRARYARNNDDESCCEEINDREGHWHANGTNQVWLSVSEPAGSESY